LELFEETPLTIFGGGAGNFRPPIEVLLGSFGFSLSSGTSKGFLTGDPGYDLDTKGGGEGGAAGAFPEVPEPETDVGTDGKALSGLIWGFEALEGTVGLAPFGIVAGTGDILALFGTESGDFISALSGDAIGGLFPAGLFEGDCLGGSEGGREGLNLGLNSLFGDTDLTVFTLALELKESLEEVSDILLRALLTCTTLSKVNLEGRAGGCC